MLDANLTFISLINTTSERLKARNFFICDKNLSSMCDNCQELEDVDHFVFHRGKYTTERNRLERTVEDTLCREGCNDVTCIEE